MSFAKQIQMMARNNAWSNDRLLRACAELSSDEFKAKRVSFFPSLCETLNHILAIDCYYIDALVGGGIGPRAFYDYQPHDDVASLATAQRQSDEQLIALCDRETNETLRMQVPTDRGGAGIFPELRGNLLLHLFTHQIHHRGQAHAMLAGTVVKPPQLDEYFLDFDAGVRADDLVRTGLPGPEAFR